MAKWIHTLDITDLWEKASNREIYASQFARAVGERLQAMTLVSKYVAGFSNLASLRDELADEFILYAEEYEAGGDEEASDYDEMDDLLSALYDWGDMVLDDSGDFFNRAKNCWIKK